MTNFSIANDLNIIAQNIEVKETQNILASNNTRLITTDGVNFIASSKNVETSLNPNNTVTGNIDINN